MTLAVFTDENGRITDGRIEDLRAERDRLDERCTEFGQSWVVRTQAPIDPEDFSTPAEIAELFHIEARSLRDMHRAGHIRRIECNGKTLRYSVGDVQNYLTAKHRR